MELFNHRFELILFLGKKYSGKTAFAQNIVKKRIEESDLNVLLDKPTDIIYLSLNESDHNKSIITKCYLTKNINTAMIFLKEKRASLIIIDSVNDANFDKIHELIIYCAKESIKVIIIENLFLIKRNIESLRVMADRIYLFEKILDSKDFISISIERSGSIKTVNISKSY